MITFGVIATFLWNEVDDFIDPEVPPTKEEILDGERKQYTSDGKLRTIVNYDKGVKHGLSTLYHKDGKTVMLSIPYQQGRREGTSKKYFESGELYAETNYQNDLLHGTRSVYYRSGNLKSVVTYYRGFPGLGTTEYLTSGKKKAISGIVHYEERGQYLFSTDQPCDDQRFFLGTLLEGQFLDVLSTSVQELPKQDGLHYLELNQRNLQLLENNDVICLCKSSQKNPLVLKTSINP